MKKKSDKATFFFVSSIKYRFSVAYNFYILSSLRGRGTKVEGGS